MSSATMEVVDFYKRQYVHTEHNNDHPSSSIDTNDNDNVEYDNSTTIDSVSVTKKERPKRINKSLRCDDANDTNNNTNNGSYVWSKQRLLSNGEAITSSLHRRGVLLFTDDTKLTFDV
jgi:archaellum component FlaF (FlaF/FlaG flagellin family)